MLVPAQYPMYLKRLSFYGELDFKNRLDLHLRLTKVRSIQPRKNEPEIF